MWFYTVILFTGHMVSIWFLLLISLKNYFVNHEFEKIVFHSLWAVVSISTVDHEIINVMVPTDIMQLANGSVTLVKQLEACKL